MCSSLCYYRMKRRCKVTHFLARIKQLTFVKSYPSALKSMKNRSGWGAHRSVCNTRLCERCQHKFCEHVDQINCRPTWNSLIRRPDQKCKDVYHDARDNTDRPARDRIQSIDGQRYLVTLTASMSACTIGSISKESRAAALIDTLHSCDCLKKQIFCV